MILIIMIQLVKQNLYNVVQSSSLFNTLVEEMLVSNIKGTSINPLLLLHISYKHLVQSSQS